jgi:hypothetical protein
MISVAKAISTVEMNDREWAEYQSWVRSFEVGHFDDEPDADEFPDWAPEPEDREWWIAEIAHLERQRPNVGPLSMAEHEARLADARRRLGLISAELAEHVAYGRNW